MSELSGLLGPIYIKKEEENGFNHKAVSKGNVMAERTYEARTIGVDYICDDCNTGVMEQMGIMLLSDPPQWPHKCNHCAATKNLWHKYPTVRWERIPA